MPATSVHKTPAMRPTVAPSISLDEHPRLPLPASQKQGIVRWGNLPLVIWALFRTVSASNWLYIVNYTCESMSRASGL